MTLALTISNFHSITHIRVGSHLPFSDM